MLRGALQVRTVLHRRESGGRAALAGYLRRPRYEVLPTEDVEGLVTTHVPPEVTITITASPRRGMEATIDLAERLSRQGYSVVPHLSARLIRDASHLREILDSIKQIGVRDVFVIAGDAREPAGQFPDSVSLLEAMMRAGRDVDDIGVSGYPESHSFIDDDMTIAPAQGRAPDPHRDGRSRRPGEAASHLDPDRRRGFRAIPARAFQLVPPDDAAGRLQPRAFRQRAPAGPCGAGPQSCRTARVHVQRDRADRAVAPGDAGARCLAAYRS